MRLPTRSAISNFGGDASEDMDWSKGSPVVHRAIFQAVDRQIGAAVGIFRGERLVDLDAEAELVAGMEVSVPKGISVRENRVGLRRVAHVFLDAEIRHPEIEVQCRREANGR